MVKGNNRTKSQQLTPGPVFQTTGVDFAGPVYTKYDYAHRPVLVKTYICVFVSFSVRAVHLEPVSDLSAEAFLAALRRFMSRRGKPKEMFSDNGTNFVGVSRELKQLYKFLRKETTQNSVSTNTYSGTLVLNELHMGSHSKGSQDSLQESRWRSSSDI